MPDPRDQSLHETLSEFFGTEFPVRATIRAPTGTDEEPQPPPQKLTLPRLSVGKEGDFVYTGVLGEGGMGVVQLARQNALDREVAVKRMRDDIPARRGRRALLTEGLHAGALEHPNIVPLHLLGVDDDNNPLLVMKRVEGREWLEVLKAELFGVESGWEDALVVHVRILLDVCNALSFAHSRRLLHRDLKPENVMIGQFGEVYLMDWGVALDLTDARACASSAPTGTPAYMAPELLNGSAQCDERTDVYLLGAVLHELLTGVAPHEARSVQESMLLSELSEAFDFDDHVPHELAALRNKAMERLKARRPKSVRDFAEALEGWLAHRASSQISDEAERHLEVLLAHLDDDGVDLVAANRLFGVCQFGFKLAAQQWPENPAVRGGLQRSFEGMIRFHLRAGNVDSAEALLEELPNPDMELAALVAQARADLPDDAPEPSIRLGGKNAIQWSNPAAQRILAQWKVELGERPPTAWRLRANRARHAGSPLEADIQLDDGSIYEVVATPSVDGHVYLRGRDVTELRAAQHRTQVMAAFPEDDPNPALRVSREGVVEYANPAAEPILAAWGVRPGQAVNEEWQGHFDKCRQTRRPLELTLTVSDKTFHMDIRPVAAVDSIYVRCRDITALSAATTKAEQTSHFADLSPLPTMRVTKDGVVDYANEASEPLLKAWMTRPGRRIPGMMLGKVMSVLSTGEPHRQDVAGHAVTITASPDGASVYIHAYPV